ncbi:MAG: hypothetical protein ABW007_12140 [Chitinophagaceae bacterium]
MKRRLSSIINPFYKFAPQGMLGYWLFLVTDDYRAVGLPLAVGGLLLFGILAKLASRLKKVYLAEDTLYVSNYLRQIRIPLSEVASVEVSSIGGKQPMTVAIRLRRPTEFGRRIVFIPRAFGCLAQDVAAEVRAAVEAQHNNGMHPTRDTRPLI